MINKNDILAQLMNGVSEDAVAQGLADVLNEAIAEFHAVQAQEDEKALKAQYVEEAVCLLKDYVAEFHGDSLLADTILGQDVDATHFVDVLDNMFAEFEAQLAKLQGLKDLVDELLGSVDLDDDCCDCDDDCDGSCGCDCECHYDEFEEEYCDEVCDCECHEEEIEVALDALADFLKANGLL